MVFKSFYKFHNIKNQLLINLIFILIPGITLCQKEPVTKVITIFNSPLKECIATDKHIWVLDEVGTIKRFLIDSYDLVDSIKLNKKIVAIAKNASDSIIVADQDGLVFKIFDSGEINLLSQTGQSIQTILFSKEGKCFLITTKGVYDLQLKKLYHDDHPYSNFAMPLFKSDGWKPSTVFIDNDDKIWLGFDVGEWGGDIVIFSTKTKQFIKFKEKRKEFCYIRPVRSFFQVDKKMYIVTSLQHFMVNSSIIELTHNKCNYLFESPKYGKDKFKEIHNMIDSQALYLGPTIFKPGDSSIYFYCQIGIYKGSIFTDLSKIENWSLVLKPDFIWYYGMPAAVGYSMNVSKMLFEKSKLYVVSPANGILIWDGAQAVILKTSYKPPKN